MIASRIIATFFAFGAISAFATPVVEKRQSATDVLAIVNTLQSSTGGILPQIDSLVNSDQATEENLSPLLEQLASALDVSGTGLNDLGRVEADDATKEEVASKVATTYTDIAKSLDNLKTKKPHFYPLVPHFGIEAALIKVLLGLGIVLVGVLKLVAALLKVVSTVLSGLGFTLLLVSLGLL